jgi:uncharacterized RDD family membrane protein YckC
MDNPAAITITRDDLATPWQRLGAAFVDGLLLGLPFGFLLVVLFFDSGSSELDVPLWFTIWSTVVFAGYHVVGTALWGQTVGKHLAGIRVCSRRDLGPPGWLRAGKRWGLYVAAGLVPVVGGLLSMVIPLPLLWTTNRQGLHDMFADTLVVRTDAITRRADVAAAWGTWA